MHWPAFLRSLVHQCIRIVFEDLYHQPKTGIPFFCPDRQYRFLELLIAGWIEDYKGQVCDLGVFFLLNRTQHWLVNSVGGPSGSTGSFGVDVLSQLYRNSSGGWTSQNLCSPRRSSVTEALWERNLWSWLQEIYMAWKLGRYKFIFLLTTKQFYQELLTSE